MKTSFQVNYLSSLSFKSLQKFAKLDFTVAVRSLRHDRDIFHVNIFVVLLFDNDMFLAQLFINALKLILFILNKIISFTDFAF